jgi:hypothetical protein
MVVGKSLSSAAINRKVGILNEYLQRNGSEYVAHCFINSSNYSIKLTSQLTGNIRIVEAGRVK